MVAITTKVRVLLQAIKNIGPSLTDEEINAIGQVLTKALDRIDKEYEKE